VGTKRKLGGISYSCGQLRMGRSIPLTSQIVVIKGNREGKKGKVTLACSRENSFRRERKKNLRRSGKILKEEKEERRQVSASKRGTRLWRRQREEETRAPERVKGVGKTSPTMGRKGERSTNRLGGGTIPDIRKKKLEGRKGACHDRE